MLVRDSDFINKKNSQEEKDPWVYLYEVEIDISMTIYLTSNTEDVEFDGNTYVKFPIASSGIIEESTNGRIPNAQIMVSAIDGTIQNFLEQYDGLRGNKVTIKMIASDFLSDPTQAIVRQLYIDKPSLDDKVVVFDLSSRLDILLYQTPKRSFLRSMCNLKYKGAGCWIESIPYSGVFSAPGSFVDHNPGFNCPKTIQECELRGNKERFGGFPGIPRSRIYIA
jgi:lambda family phage minor tail protein L